MTRRVLCFKGKDMYFRWRHQNQDRTGSDRIGLDWIGLDRTGSDQTGSDQTGLGSWIRSLFGSQKKSFEEKKNPIVYDLVINKK